MRILQLILNYGKKFPISWAESQVGNYHYTSSLIFHKKYLSCTTKILYVKYILETQSYDDKDKKELEEWLAVQKSVGIYVPEKISKEVFHLLLDAKSIQQRLNILSHSYRRLKYAEANTKYKEIMTRKREERYVFQNSSHIKYGLWNNSIFSKTFQAAMIDLCSHRLVSAAINSQPLIIDLTFESNMNLVEKKLLKREILSSVKYNLKRHEPINLILCNAKSGTLRQNIENHLPKNFPMVITSKSYLELYKKEKLIYLTKDATEEMVKFDHDAIYIIGGLVDHGKKYPITLEKANNEGIQAQKLPLTSFPDSPLKKHITLNVSDVVHMLLEVHETGMWKSAFKKIPNWQVRRANGKSKISLGVDEGSNDFIFEDKQRIQMSEKRVFFLSHQEKSLEHKTRLMESKNGGEMKLVQQLQLCVCLSIIKETPEHITPKEFAQLLQKVAQELDSSPHGSDSIVKKADGIISNLPGNSKSTENEIVRTRPKPLKIAVKPQKKLLSPRSLSSNVQKGDTIGSTPSSALTLASSDENHIIPSTSSLSNKVVHPDRLSLPSKAASNVKDGAEKPVSLNPSKSGYLSVPSSQKLSSYNKRTHSCAPIIRKTRPVIVGRPMQHLQRETLAASQSVDSLLPQNEACGMARNFNPKNLQQRPCIQASTMRCPSHKQLTLPPDPLDLEDLPSFLEEFGYEKYFRTYHLKIEALDLILTDFLRAVQQILLGKRTFNERTIEEILKVLQVSEANEFPRSLKLCITFYTDLLNILINVHQQTNINFDCVRKIFEVTKKIIDLHWQHLEPCGETTLHFLCHLFVLNARRYFVDDIGSCAADLLSKIVVDMKEMIALQITPTQEESLNLIDVALSVITQEKQHFKNSNTDESHLNGAHIQGCLWRWKWMLQDRMQNSQLSPLFSMQVTSLLHTLDYTTK